MSSSGNHTRDQESDAERARVEELETRIDIITGLGEEELGAWTPLDWVLITVLGVVGPLLVLIWFSP